MADTLTKTAARVLKVQSELERARPTVAEGEQARARLGELEAGALIGEPADRKALAGLRKVVAGADAAARAVPALEAKLAASAQGFGEARAGGLQAEARACQVELHKLEHERDELAKEVGLRVARVNWLEGEVRRLVAVAGNRMTVPQIVAAAQKAGGHDGSE